MTDKSSGKVSTSVIEDNPFKEVMDKFYEMTVTDRESRRKKHLALTDSPEAIKAFYKHYVKLDSWLLYEEALPISAGVHPHAWDAVRDLYPNWEARLRPIMKSAVSISLPLINPDAKERRWRVKPKDFVKWLHSKELWPRKELEEALGIEHKAKSKKKTDYSDHPNAEHNAQKRQKVLEAALAILAAFPDQCRKGDKVSPAEIARIMEEKSPIWFGNEDIPLSERGVRELISSAIKTLAK
jgi:hypothetical protein